MTIEQRFDFLFASIESHNQQIGDIAELQARNSREIAELRATMREGFERLERNIERTEKNIDRLALAMTGLVEHAANHARRLERLEGLH